MNDVTNELVEEFMGIRIRNVCISQICKYYWICGIDCLYKIMKNA